MRLVSFSKKKDEEFDFLTIFEFFFIEWIGNFQAPVSTPAEILLDALRKSLIRRTSLYTIFQVNFFYSVCVAHLLVFIKLAVLITCFEDFVLPWNPLFCTWTFKHFYLSKASVILWFALTTRSFLIEFIISIGQSIWWQRFTFLWKNSEIRKFILNA